MKAEQIQKILISKGKTLVTAESCTGGRIAALLTSVSGSSEYFRGGVVTYQTEIKELVLKVPSETIDTFGVVSPETAESMRVKVCQLLQADYAISITGFAGPTGGTEVDPVGTAYVSVGSANEGKQFRVVSNKKNRTEIQDDFAQQALDLFFNYIQSID